MLNILKKIAIIEDIQTSSDGKSTLSMRIGGHRAKAESYQRILVSALFLAEYEVVTDSTLHYLTQLLAAHPDTHDYALQLTADGVWLWCQHDKYSAVERLTARIEKQVYLLRYLHTVITRKHQNDNVRNY